MNPPIDPGQSEQDVRPRVANVQRTYGPLFFGVALFFFGFLLFQGLEARRALLSSTTTRPGASDPSRIAAPPQLAIPPHAVGLDDENPTRPPPRLSIEPSDVSSARVSYPAAIGSVRREASGLADTAPPIIDEPWNPVPATARADLDSAPSDRARDSPKEDKDDPDRVKARRFQNPATTIAKGTVVQAVLETALDSTRGGFARAIVTRDTYGFDGSRILIPRGSRIIGEYKSDATLGQKRVLIQWQRLMRPDGVMIDLDSPSTDPLGRAGVRGRVNTHFWERYSGAILQSSLDAGVQLATRAASNNSVVVGLPGSTQAGGTSLQVERIAPTIKVRQGTGVAVFVAKDLDFTDTDQ